MATAEELFEQGFDAIYVATGAGLPKFLNVPGENLPNVFFANEYLTRINLMHAWRMRTTPPSLPAKK